MENKEAVRRAKEYVKDIFSDERIDDIRLEAIKKASKTVWDVTIGFSRILPRKTFDGASSTVALERTINNLFGDSPAVTAYKRIKIRDSDGEVLEMTDPDWN
jgi:hypothetical protein